MSVLAEEGCKCVASVDVGVYGTCVGTDASITPIRMASRPRGSAAATIRFAAACRKAFRASDEVTGGCASLKSHQFSLL